MSKIPNSFKLFSTTIEVKFDSARLSFGSKLGDCSFIDNLITLSNSYKGEEINESAIIDTFYHEKVHVILDAMGEHEISQNEKFVEVFSRLLRQSDDTSTFKLK